jgi:hypothetical protein
MTNPLQCNSAQTAGHKPLPTSIMPMFNAQHETEEFSSNSYKSPWNIHLQVSTSYSKCVNELTHNYSGKSNPLKTTLYMALKFHWCKVS